MPKIINFPTPTPHSPYLLTAKNIDEIVFYTKDGTSCFIDAQEDIAVIMAMVIRSKMKIYKERTED
jgi:hypothetical protein